MCCCSAGSFRAAGGSILQELFLSVLQLEQPRDVHSRLFSTRLSASGAGAPGSQSAVVTVGQTLWEAGGMSVCFGSPPVLPVLSG